MPPGGKLSDAQIDDLVAWVRMGAPDPRTHAPGGATLVVRRPRQGALGVQAGHEAGAAGGEERRVGEERHRSLRAGEARSGRHDRQRAAPTSARSSAARTSTSSACRRRRSRCSAFLADASPNAFEKVVDRLLASPRYGERWGRHWLDVARYADSKGQHDRRRRELDLSVRLDLSRLRHQGVQRRHAVRPVHPRAARRRPAERQEESGRRSAALGFLTLGDHFNGRPADVINDRIDVTSKAFLGLTVTCARCHDHKFDPIPTADYYSLYGIFASSVEPRDKPIIAPPNAAHADYLVKRQRDGRPHQRAARAEHHGGVRRLQAAGRRLPPGHDDAERRARRRTCRRTARDPALLQNWTQFTRGGGPAGAWRSSASGTRWRAFRRRDSRMQAPRVLDNQYDERERARAMLSPVVLRGVPAASRRRTHRGSRGDLREAVREDRSGVGSDDVVGRGSATPCCASCRRARGNQFFELREQSDMLELVDPGAPPRAQRPRGQPDAEGLAHLRPRPGRDARRRRAAPLPGSAVGHEPADASRTAAAGSSSPTRSRARRTRSPRA